MKLLMHQMFGVCEGKRTSPGEGKAGVQAVKYADCQGDGGRRKRSRDQDRMDNMDVRINKRNTAGYEVLEVTCRPWNSFMSVRSGNIRYLESDEHTHLAD